MTRVHGHSTFNMKREEFRHRIRSTFNMKQFHEQSSFFPLCHRTPLKSSPGRSVSSSWNAGSWKFPTVRLQHHQKQTLEAVVICTFEQNCIKHLRNTTFLQVNIMHETKDCSSPWTSASHRRRSHPTQPVVGVETKAVDPKAVVEAAADRQAEQDGALVPVVAWEGAEIRHAP